MESLEYSRQDKECRNTSRAINLQRRRTDRLDLGWDSTSTKQIKI